MNFLAHCIDLLRMILVSGIYRTIQPRGAEYDSLERKKTSPCLKLIQR